MTTAPACGSCTKPVTDAYLCADCTRDLAIALLTAANIAPDLDDAIARLLKRGTGSGPSGSATEAPLPVDLAASNAKDKLSLKLGVAVSGIQLPPGAPGYARDWPYNTIGHMARWLAARLGRIRQHEHAPRWHHAIHRAVRDALAVIDTYPERAPAGQCEACGAQLLAELGADEVTCRCGVLTTALRATRRERAAAADVLGTATEIAGALEQLGIRVTASTIRTWASRGRLGARPGPKYAMSDVLALCAQRDSRR